MKDKLELVTIDELSSTPKHLQLAQAFLRSIEAGNLQTNDTLPSLNDLRDRFDINRDTAEKCYKWLRVIGVIASVPGKGYYIKNSEFRYNIRVMLLFNKLSARKQIIYNAFAHTLGDNASIDFYIYNNDFTILRKILLEKKDPYTHYVIIPHFTGISDERDIPAILNTIPKEKLILLDKEVAGVEGNYGLVYENFEKDIYGALSQAKEALSKYQTLKIIFPGNSYYPQEIIRGFQIFCQDFAFTPVVLHDIVHEQIRAGEAYICLQEDDLVILVERIIAEGFELSKEIGVISYNETPLKKLIQRGITTISTDFKMMGEKAASMILRQQRERIELPFYLTLRPSL